MALALASRPTPAACTRWSSTWITTLSPQTTEAASSCDRDGTPLDVGRVSRTVPAKLRRAVVDRARGRCQYPGCERRSWLQIHHVHHWIDGGPTAYANLAVLCGTHHRAHHGGTFTISHDRQVPGDFAFHLSNGVPIEHAPTFPTLAGDLTDHHGATITCHTIQPDWPGDPLRLDYAVDVMTTRVAQRQSAPSCN